MKHRVCIHCLAVTALLALTVYASGLPVARAQTPNRAGLVVHFGDGTVVTLCVEFSESQISGYDLLERSGLDVTAAYDSGEGGVAICKIEYEGEGKGCLATNCLMCDYPRYWSYWHLSGGDWVYSQAGSSVYMVHNGAVEGWSWGIGDSDLLPVVTFDEICAPPPTDTPQPTDVPQSPTGTPTRRINTQVPTDTPAPTSTPIPATATSPPPSPQAWFRLDANPIPTGTCTTLRWNTANALEVYVDGERVDLNGSQEVCPSAPQEYRLRVVGAAGEQTHTLSLGVTSASPSPEPTAHPAALSSPSPTPTPVPTVAPATVASPGPAATPRPATATSPPPTSAAGPAAGTSSPPVPATRSAAAHLPSPSPVPARAVALSASPSLTPLARPALTPSPSSGASRLGAEVQRPASAGGYPLTLLFGYAAFGLIVVGLLGWLVVVILRQR